MPAPVATVQLATQEYDYEKITRQIRWVVILIVLATLPPGQPQTSVIFGWTMLAVVYNLSRYFKPLMTIGWYSSRITMLVVDNLFIAGLVLFANRPDLAYTGFLGLMILTGTYWYGLRGTISVLTGQFLLLAAISTQHLYPPLQPDVIRTTILSSMVLLVFGLLLERLTHIERLERATLQKLSQDNQIEQERLLALVNSLHDATLVLDSKGRIMQSNGALRELAGKQGDLNGQNVASVLPMHRRAKGGVQWSDILNDSPQRHRDLTLKGNDGNDLNLDINITPVRLPKLKDTNYIVVARDITKEKSLDQQREEFIAVASHELRTPLSIVEAALSTALLQKSTLPDLTVDLMTQAHENTVFLASLVKELTTLSKAQNDSIPIELQPVNPRLLLERIVKDYTPQAEPKNLSLKFVVKPNTPSVLSTEAHIQEILGNYISNALKYTLEGGVIVSAEASSNGGVLFQVQDSGIGISKSDQKHMFTKFYRAEDYRTRATGGTGLGLYLCLELAERINGKIWCTSTLNHGSTFFLEVPPFSQLDRDHGKVVEAEVSNLINQL